jgi:hypothetical protein
MDIRIAPYEALIQDLISLQQLNFSQEEILFISQCIALIKRTAILRTKFPELYYLDIELDVETEIEIETDLDRLNKIEATFKEHLYRIISYAEIIYLDPQLNAFPQYLSSMTCFIALATIGIIIGIFLSTPLTPVAGILLSLAMIGALFVFQGHSLLLANHSPAFCYLQETRDSLMKNLSHITIRLTQTLGSLEDKIKLQENFQTPPSSPTQLTSNFFGPDPTENSPAISLNNPASGPAP